MNRKLHKINAIKPGKKKAALKYPKLPEFLVNAFAFAGLILSVCTINIYRLTLIDPNIPRLIALMSMIIFWPINIWVFKNYVPEVKHFLLRLFYQLITFGSFSSFTFLAANYYIAKGDMFEVSVPILETGYFAKGRSNITSPYAMVNLEGKSKQLAFGANDELKDYNFILLKMQKGLLGFDIIVAKTLIKNSK